MSLHASKIPIVLHDLKQIAGINAYYKNGIFYLETSEIEFNNGLFVCTSEQRKLIELCRIINFYLYELDTHLQGA
ncbi:hypothetical protein [Ectobacillus panaciterrae]|uniref:hypothetical protein n=1 Tax=Ectobacillus panaciterrae TaxID=363872 RepID=UPI00048F3BD3|nr:hypothetical protein [Ectobacillus panaciterrae]